MAASRQATNLFKHSKKVVNSGSKKREPPIARSLDNDNNSSQDESDLQSTATTSGNLGKRQKSVRPNAFLSFRIMNQQILEQAIEIQKQIIESNSLLAKASVAIPTLHITLMVFALKNEEDKQRAKQCLIDACHQIGLAELSSPQITFTGLSTFNNKVLFMDPVKDAQLDVLTRIAEICRETYEKNGIRSLDDRPFNPHLTLFKLSKLPRKEGIKKLDTSWSKKFAGQHFGVENIQSLQLCSMIQKKQSDGFYHTYHEQQLFDGTNSTDTNLPSPVLTIDEIEPPIDVNNIVILSSAIIDDHEKTPTVEAVMHESIVCSTVINEASSLLPRDPMLHEDAFSGIASFLPHSRDKESSCCSVA